ncbi:hypothetical protein AB7M49_007016 [Bradyrhizobium elkanii]
MSDPADYARSHWRQFESPEEHAERVEAAERDAGWYFAQATKAQRQTYTDTMAFLRGFSGPIWERRRAAAQATWEQTTAGAAALFNITADEIMRDGEMSEATRLAWDVLIDQAEHAPAPFTPTTHHQAQAGL